MQYGDFGAMLGESAFNQTYSVIMALYPKVLLACGVFLGIFIAVSLGMGLLRSAFAYARGGRPGQP